MDPLRKSLPPVDLADLLAAARLRPAATAGEVARLAVQAERATRASITPTPNQTRSLAASTLAALRRLLDVEAELATVRATIAEHTAARDDGDDRDHSDLLSDLDRAGVGITEAEYDEAAGLRAAEIAAVTR